MRTARADAWPLAGMPGSWRSSCAFWSCSALLHLPLLYWSGRMMGPADAPALLPLEVSLEEEGTALAQAPAVGAGPSSARSISQALARVPAGPKPSAGEVWKSIQAAGTWGRSGQEASAVRKHPDLVKDSLKGLAANPVVPSQWQPRKQERNPALASPLQDEPSGDATARSLAASPWSSSTSEGAKADPKLSQAAALSGGFSGPEEPSSGPSADLSEIGERGGSDPKGSAYELQGPLAKRRILHLVLPSYPDWALEQGVEGSVTVYFIVLPDGRVQEPGLLRKTSGDPRLDALAMGILKEWRFAALSRKQEEKQWGTLTFHFRLKG